MHCSINSLAPYDIVLRWMSQDLTDDKSTLIQLKAWCCQATSHHLNQCWPRSPTPYGVTSYHNELHLTTLDGCCFIKWYSKTDGYRILIDILIYNDSISVEPRHKRPKPFGWHRATFLYYKFESIVKLYSMYLICCIQPLAFINYI